MKKKSSLVARIGVLALVLTLVTTTMMSGTLARYVTQEVGEAQAVIAKWSAQAQYKTATGEYESISAKTLNFADIVNKSTLKTTAASGTIAPGMEGSFTVQVDMTDTQVLTEYEVYLFYIQGSGTAVKNFEFSQNGTDFNKPATLTADDASHLGDTYTFNTDDRIAYGTIDPINGSDTKKEVAVYWQWPLEAGTAASKKAYNDDDVAAGESSKLTNQYRIVVRMIQKEQAPTPA